MSRAKPASTNGNSRVYSWSDEWCKNCEIAHRMGPVQTGPVKSTRTYRWWWWVAALVFTAVALVATAVFLYDKPSLPKMKKDLLAICSAILRFTKALPWLYEEFSKLVYHHFALIFAFVAVLVIILLHTCCPKLALIILAGYIVVNSGIFDNSDGYFYFHPLSPEPAKVSNGSWQMMIGFYFINIVAGIIADLLRKVMVYDVILTIVVHFTTIFFMLLRLDKFKEWLGCFDKICRKIFPEGGVGDTFQCGGSFNISEWWIFALKLVVVVFFIVVYMFFYEVIQNAKESKVKTKSHGSSHIKVHRTPRIIPVAATMLVTLSNAVTIDRDRGNASQYPMTLSLNETVVCSQRAPRCVDKLAYYDCNKTAALVPGYESNCLTPWPWAWSKKCDLYPANPPHSRWNCILINTEGADFSVSCDTGAVAGKGCEHRQDIAGCKKGLPPQDVGREKDDATKTRKELVKEIGAMARKAKILQSHRIWMENIQPITEPAHVNVSDDSGAETPVGNVSNASGVDETPAKVLNSVEKAQPGSTEGEDVSARTSECIRGHDKHWTGVLLPRSCDSPEKPGASGSANSKTLGSKNLLEEFADNWEKEEMPSQH